jgi:hypothetical protein
VFQKELTAMNQPVVVDFETAQNTIVSHKKIELKAKGKIRMLKLKERFKLKRARKLLQKELDRIGGDSSDDSDSDSGSSTSDGVPTAPSFDDVCVAYEGVMQRMNESRANVEIGRLDADIRIARKQQDLNKITRWAASPVSVELQVESALATTNKLNIAMLNYASEIRKHELKIAIEERMLQKQLEALD